jgi:predicted  nucleic acid-binding Zn-ribbon protein
MEKCNQNLSIEEISSTFGNSDNISKCKSCSNFVYEDGLLTCKLLLESVGNK